ncbi:uncharacterized protein LOC122011109 [Zingiber officinale]|uniref:uncharacterized protein LOC122011109 n=1 Tax=Zingiber officinale TaxID=94328 RepID=UPI001C4B6512|nr:uncharacterized protein LOC122011109 [Zingiber officinale]
MEVYLKTNFDQWFNITKGYKASVDHNTRTPINLENWNLEMKKKARSDFKALNTIQCGLTEEELNHVGLHKNVKELWDEFIELHEGTNDAKITKRDLFLNKLFNIIIQEGETANQLHARIKDILNGLHTIGHQMESQDLIRYALNAFPLNAL